MRTTRSAKRKAIICIGNRLISHDAAGPQVYDHLQNQTLPNDLQLIDGAIAGLDLASYFEGRKIVVVVDAIEGFFSKEGICSMSREELMQHTSIQRYDHASGLLYLLHILPDIIEGPMPTIHFVGVQGKVTDNMVQKAALKCLEIIKQ